MTDGPLPLLPPRSLEPRERAVYAILRPLFHRAEQADARDSFLDAIDGIATAASLVLHSRAVARRLDIPNDAVTAALDAALAAPRDLKFPAQDNPVPAAPATAPEKKELTR